MSPESPIRVPILMYHRIGDPPSGARYQGHYTHPVVFERQLLTLKRFGFQPVSLADVGHKELPRKPVVITLDDGYANNQLIFPTLQSHQVPATVFLVSGHIGGTNQWDMGIGEVEERLLDADQIQKAQSMGIEFGSHTVTHAKLDRCTHEEARREVFGSREDLAQLLGKPPLTFAYPDGKHREDTKALVQKAGYCVAVSTQKGAQQIDPFALKRIHVRRDVSLPMFILRLFRAMLLDC